MIVKLKENPPFKKYTDDNVVYFDKNKEYKVISIASPDYILIDELGELISSPMLFFDIIDNSMDEDWVTSVEDYGDGEYDIKVLVESKELSDFLYCKFFENPLYKKDFFIQFLNKRGIVLKSNLAYCPLRGLKKYYTELLEKIDKGRIK